MLNRKNPPFQSHWALPGGFLDPGESPSQAAARELAEAADGTLYLYPGTAHLVADDSHGDHDPAIADQILRRTLAFVEAVSTPPAD